MIDVRYDDRSIRLVGWGAVPAPRGYTNAQVCEALGLPLEIASAVEEMIGTRFRYSCVDLHTKKQLVAASSLGYDAVQQALERAALGPESVQGIISVATILDHYCPSTAVRIQKLLGLDAGITYDLVGGCGAWMQGIVLGAGLLSCGLLDTVVIVAAEPLTRLLWTGRRTWEPLAFGDGAAAMVLSTRHPGPFVLRRCVLETAADLGGSREEIMTIPILGDVLPPLLAGSDRMDPLLPAFGYPDEYRTTHHAGLAARWGAHFMSLAVERVTAGLPRHSMYLCPHQPSRVVLGAVRERLGLAAEQIASINPRVGNLSSASSPTAFAMCFDEGPARFPWTVLAPIGTGLTYGAALLERVTSPHDHAHPRALDGTSPWDVSQMLA